MKASAIAIMLCLWVNTLMQTESLEKQALILVQRTPASDLDEVLPKVSFVTWFNQLVGPRAGVIWQLTECGEAIKSPPNLPDLNACLEANAGLPDGQKVMIAFTIGTFKKGLAGRAAFLRGVVEYNEQLYPANRLSELPQMLSGQKAQYAGAKPMPLPVIDTEGVRITWLPKINPPWPSVDNNVLTASLDSREILSPPSSISIPTPDPPQSSPPSTNQPQSIRKVESKVLEGNAITRVNPVYPPTARMMRAFGTVSVQITISEAGRVTEARAISGHMALRSAAVEAAYKWVFKPTTVNGSPIKVQGILNFTFTNNFNFTNNYFTNPGG